MAKLLSEKIRNKKSTSHSSQVVKQKKITSVETSYTTNPRQHVPSDGTTAREMADAILSMFITEHDPRNYATMHGNLEIFIRHLEGTYLSIVSTLEPTITTRHAKEKELLKFIIDKCQFGEEPPSINIPLEHLSEFRRIEKDYNQFYTASVIIPRSTIITLISYFDHLMGRIVQCLYKSKPEIINLSDKQITLAQLNDFGSLSAAQDYFLEKEIELLLRRSHTEQFEWLESKFNINLRTNQEDWANFIELTERRNLYVHTNGRVSNQYLQVCKKNKVPVPSGLKSGDYLITDLSYFKKSYSLVYKLGVQLTHVLWRKILPDQKQHADESFVDVTYNLLKEEDYNLAIELFDFLFNTPHMQRFHDDYTRRLHIINRAQAYKWSGDNPACQKLLDNEDWSSTGDRFKLAI